MKFGSLFSGIGGFDLGFERAGLECAWQVEIDRDCQRVLKRAWPNVQRFDDVTTVREFSAVDVLCGGFPCQDLSVAGKRKGLAGERSGLWFEFLRIIKSSQPRWVVIENVPGLLSSESGADFRVIIDGLVNVGYCVGWRVFDAQYFGVAQRRRRVFIVGSLGNGSCAEILFESESVSWNPPTRREARERVAPCLDASPYADREAEHGRLIAHALRSEGADASEDGTGRGTPLVVAEAIDVRNLKMQPDGISGTMQHKKSGGYSLNYQNPIFTIQHAQVGRKDEAGPQGKGYQEDVAFTVDSRPTADIVAFSSKDHGADAGEISPTLRSMNFDKSHINGGGQVAIAFEKDRISHWVDEKDRIRAIQSDGHSSTAQEHVYFKPNAQVNSLEHSRAPKTVGSFGVRRLTPRECERLQSFPDDFTRWDADGKEISDSARYRMLGNAVPVNVSQWIGERIAKLER